MASKISKTVLGASLAVVLLSACLSPASSPPDFQSSVAAHLESVETRDFETFKSTLTQSDDLTLIFAGGTLLPNTQAVLDFHQEWFKDEDWVFNTNIEKVILGKTQSTALVKYDFRDTADGPPREAWLVLTFQLEDNQWRLIHDQNTRIVAGL